MEKKLRIDGLKPDACPGSPWMLAFIADCYDLLSSNLRFTAKMDRKYADLFAKRAADEISEAPK